MLVDVLKELTDRFLPMLRPWFFVQQLCLVLRERPVKLSLPQSPHSFHGLLPVLAEVQSAGPLVECNKQSPDYVIDMRF